MHLSAGRRAAAALLVFACLSSARLSAEGDEATAPIALGTHLFDGLPNHAPAQGGSTPSRLSATRLLHMAALSAVGPYGFPVVGVVSSLDHTPGLTFTQRYATAWANKALGTALTTAVMPLATGQDPRYVVSGTGSLARRLGYAASRSVITADGSGHAQFNVSEIGGSAMAAALSNLYAPSTERTMTGTLTRWGMQLVWHTLSNELHEYWPDIRAKLQRRAAVS
jgi:hypothetical protein